jgi:signal transduction histidine kinase
LRTIRWKLIVGVVPGLVLLISALSAALYIYMFDVLTAQQDSSLLNRAHVVMNRAHWSHDDPAQLVSPDIDSGEFGRTNRPSCFEIFSYDGAPLIRSQLLGKTDLPIPDLNDDGPRWINLTFTNGRPGRAVALRYTPAVDSDVSLSGPMQSALAAGKKFTIVLGKDAGTVRDPTLVLLLSLIALVAIMATGIIVLMSLALHRGLQPLERIAKQAASRSSDDAPELFPTDGIPGELLPICDRLNDLLRRLYTALQRQRRFTTDAAHELRTPIAEIRAVAEVGAKWADLPTARASLVDVLEVSRKMETIVTNLLAMARCDFAKQELNFQPVDLNSLIDKVWQTFTPRAGERGISIRMNLVPKTFVHSDPVLLESILVNLFSNAAEYATAGSTLSCATRLSDDGLRLEVANDVEGISQEDVTHFFEPFWRKDAALSDDRHCGLGLTLTKAYADLLKAPLTIELLSVGRLNFSLQLPLSASPPAEKLQPVSPAGVDARATLPINQNSA